MEWLEGIYGELRITRVNVHEYLGMKLDFRTTGEIWVTMVYYLKGVLEDLPEVTTGRSMIPAANNMFQVRPEDKRMLLNEERATAFHHTVSQLVFVTSSARNDIKMDVSFLCTRVRIPDEDDSVNLVRVLRYIRGTLHLPLILRDNSLSVLKWWVDAPFTTHPYFKENTGVMMSMVSVSIMELSRNKQ